MRHLAGPDGITLAIHELGGEGRPTLLCHATGFHGLVWAPYAAALGGGFERWSIDFRAHGASVVAEGQALDWTGFCQDVLTAVDGLDLPAGQILGIGHSMGGAALLLAEQERPGTFAGLYLFEPIAPPIGAFPTTPTGSNPLADGAARRRATFPSAAEALANYAAKPPLDRLRADALHAYVRHGFVPDGEDGAVRLACRPADESQVYRGAPSHSAFGRLGEVGCPVVIATGDEPFGPALFAPPIADALPHGRLERFAQLGHFGPLEAPDRVAAATAAFADTLGDEVPRGVTPHA
jgi:pimeloyl-ACP methyl ester carboxylesterase